MFCNKSFKSLGIMSIILLTYFFNVMDVYAYKVTFNQASGEWIVGTCYTGLDNKISTACLDKIGTVCKRWSQYSYDVAAHGGTSISGYDGVADIMQWQNHKCIYDNFKDCHDGYFSSSTFSSDTVYYCVSGSSNPEHDNEKYDKCYVCNDNDNIMKWSADGNDDPQCEGGYHESTTVTEEGLCVTKPQSCYECENDENVMGWGYSAVEVKNNDNGACSGNYKVSSITDKDLCVTKRPACYICKDEGKSHIMQWGIELNTLPDCSKVEKDESINESSCVTKTPSCYVCNVEGEKHVMGWGYSAEDVKNNDNNACSGSYVEDSNINETACVTKKPACYICKDEGKGHIMEWGIELNTLPNCSQIEKDDTINESSCVTKTPSCYVCETDNNVMGWGYTADSLKQEDNGLCSGNYIKDENIKEDMCMTNVKTGQTGVYIIVVGFVGALIYIIYYYFRHVKKASI